MISNEAEMQVNNIWFEDKLNRKGYADFLYQVIASAETSEAEDNALIFAIDGEWGTGKSFFINCWMRDLEAKGHLVSRFDAWKNDIVDEPLIGFLSHIYGDLERWDESRSVKLAGQSIKKSQKRLLPIAQELVKGAGVKALGYLVTDEVAKEVAKSISDGTKEVLESEKEEQKEIASFSLHTKLKAHNKNIQLIEEFKAELSKVAADLVNSKNSSKAPVFIFIDELDRCRPDYAVRLLEVVKHIFNSKGICFISSVNIGQLQESIKTIYGLNFESDKYLDRFFNHRLKLPAPSTRDYISSLPLFAKIRSSKIKFSSNIDEDEEKILRFYSRICDANSFDLRTIKSLFYRLDVCRKILKDEILEYNYDEVIFIILSLIKTNNLKHESFKDALSLSEYSINEFDYFLIDQRGRTPTLITMKYGELVKIIEKIYHEHKIQNRSRTFIIDQKYEMFNLVLSTWGAHRGNEEVAIRKMHKYVEVCAMSGRLDE